MTLRLLEAAVVPLRLGWRARACHSRTLSSAHQYISQHDELWVFAYGSLMWQEPSGVQVERRAPCVLPGYARSFCVHSRNYRGTPTAPGLVLGLESSNSSCVGIALHLGSSHSAEAVLSLERIDAQEMVVSRTPPGLHRS